MYTLNSLKLSATGILLFLLFIPVQEHDWTSYRVERGSHDFLPNDFPAPYFGADRYTADIMFTASCWWSREDSDYSGGNDIKDWNKIGGMTNYFNANSTHSVLLGWRPSALPGIMEVAAYINPKSGRFVSGPVLQVAVDEPLYAEIQWSTDSVSFQYGELSFSYPVGRPWAVRKIGPWFGGNQTAHREMVLLLDARLD